MISCAASHPPQLIRIVRYTYIYIRLSIYSFQIKVDHLLYDMCVPSDNMSNAFVAQIACQSPNDFECHEISQASASAKEVLGGHHQLLLIACLLESNKCTSTENTSFAEPKVATPISATLHSQATELWIEPD